MRNVKDAEANDMIHMGSDHGCVMATFLINTPEKNTHVRREDKKHEPNVNVEHKNKAKNINIEKSELEERYQEIIVTIKEAAAKKENEVHDTRNNEKDQMERTPQQQQKQKAHLLTLKRKRPKEGARSAAAKQITNGVVQLNTSIDVRRVDVYTPWK